MLLSTRVRRRNRHRRCTRCCRAPFRDCVGAIENEKENSRDHGSLEGPLFTSDKMMLFDFTSAQNVDDWREMSDTVRTVGKSKAVLTLQTSQLFQRAVFFTLLNPQANGAGFAGVRTPTNLDLSRFKDIEITCRGQGQNSNYKISLRHKGQDSNADLSYEQFFTVLMSNDEFSTVTLPLKDFKPYYRGHEMPDGEPLDTTNITMFEFQIYGGVYMPIKQRGVSALEIETVAAVFT
ncbi:PREDICTED: uncharacterized protein LOC106743833 isoform X2 [Dinoponera quadriceps]|uniref:Uncharacterized protein LOC106743833 isoform X2 n=1 Tax=Dinoponera quadriceps TaxID=609295 RepID=A0A6P3X5J2_DINQU|nr:PREDICTED: uncharacterized protein LOC106743833 isoform X2 [Dinoponera quadriceps]